MSVTPRLTSAMLVSAMVRRVNAGGGAAVQQTDRAPELFEVGCHDVNALALGNDAISSAGASPPLYCSLHRLPTGVGEQCW